jgi:hypothetical protein
MLVAQGIIRSSGKNRGIYIAMNRRTGTKLHSLVNFKSLAGLLVEFKNGDKLL